MKLIALLRGINISGKNKIDMKELKNCFEEIGFSSVKTILNSGNILFETNDNETLEIINKNISSMINKKFGLTISVLIITLESLEEILHHAPNWWGTDDKEIYDNLIFIFPEHNFTEVASELGDIQPQIEQIENYQNVIFWSFNLQNYRKSLWYSKTAMSPVNTKITVRTAGTVKKIINTVYK